jgi:hypothetical protein
MHYEMTFPAEIQGYLQSINAVLRSQYNLAYELEQPHEAGKKYKLEVKVRRRWRRPDRTNKTFVVQHRPYVLGPPLPSKADKKN